MQFLENVKVFRFKPMPLLLAVALLANLGACRSGSRASDRLAEDSAAVQQIDNNLSFSNITLEQPDEQGKLLWKVNAKQATYNEGKGVALVTSPEGELYSEGKPVYKIKAQTGEVLQNGDRIFLKGQVVATDLKSKAVLQGDELVWTPKDGVLVVRKNLRGTHPQIAVRGNEARLYQKERRMEVKGQVVAVTADPALQLRAEKLTWFMDAERVVSDRPVQIGRLRNQRITDAAAGDKAEVNLKTKVVTLTQNAQVAMQQPPLLITSNVLVWNMPQDTITSDQPVTVVQRQQGVVLNANRGRFNLKDEIAYLSGNVRAVGDRNQAQLRSDDLVWNIQTQNIQATGNVDYRQANPPLTVTGPRAVGRLANRTVVVSGGRVVSEFVP